MNQPRRMGGRRTWRRACMLFVAATAMVVPVDAGPILLYTETSLGGGLWRYEYTLRNDLDPVSSSGVNLYDAVLQFGLPATVVALPTDWAFIQDSVSVEVFSTIFGAPPAGSDIPPGANLPGFIFDLDQQSGAIPFTYTYFDEGNPSQPLVLSGTATQAAVPEPSALSLSLLGIGALALARARRSSRALTQCRDTTNSE